MPIKFYVSIPVSYITPDLPPGRYLVSAAGLWDRRKERFRWEKLDCLDPNHEILIDSGGYSFLEYPEGYVAQYKKDAEYALSITINETFFQIDRLGDVAFTEAHRTPHTVPIVRADAKNNILPDLLHAMPECDFIAVGGLKKFPVDVAAYKCKVILMDSLKKRKRVHILGAGLKIMNALKPFIQEECPDLEISCDSGSWNSRFGSRINEFNAIMQANGWTQRETALKYYLPRYREEIES